MREFIIIAIIIVTVTVAHAGVTYNKSQLIEIGNNDKLTAYLIKETKTVNGGGSIGFDTLYVYTEKGQKEFFADRKKNDRPNIAVVTYQAQCSSHKNRVAYVKLFKPGKDLDSGAVKGKFETYNVKAIDGALAEEACKPDFE